MNFVTRTVVHNNTVDHTVHLLLTSQQLYCIHGIDKMVPSCDDDMRIIIQLVLPDFFKIQMYCTVNLFNFACMKFLRISQVG